MLPGNTLSSAPYYAQFAEPIGKQAEPLIDYEMGGSGIGDPGQGLSVQLWKVRVDGDDVKLSAPTVPEFVYITRPGITEISLAFDQNMRAYLAFVQAGTPYLYWWDTLASAMTFTAYPGIITPKVGLDEKRSSELGNSDVIFAYMKAGDLCYRQQRDRFGTERVLKAGANGKLVTIGANSGLRFQFKVKPN